MPEPVRRGPTQTAKQEVDTQRWAARPSTARLLRFGLFIAPLLGSLLIAFWAASAYPPDRLGLNRWVWWLGLAVVATAIVRILERAIGRLTPIATLFQLSLVFPDQAPSRFSTALRSGSARALQRRLDDMKERGEVFSPDDSYAQQMLDLIRMLSEHDRMTRGHAERVRAYAELIGEEMGLRQDDLDKLRWGALLHDMGKLEVPSEILNKPGRPSEEEWAILQRHPAAGIPYLAPLKDWLGDWVHAADGHHERWDGNGYPRGLAGTEIALSARIVAVADAFDVMTSTRSYKSAMPLELGRQEVADKAGSQFDPEVARAFLKVSIGDVRRAAGPLAWFTSLPGLQHIPFGAATSQAVTTITAATAVAIGGATGLALPESSPPPAVAFAEEDPAVAAADIAIDEDTTGTITVTFTGGGPYTIDLIDVPGGSVATVGAPSPDLSDGDENISISFTPPLDGNGRFDVGFVACAGEICFDEQVRVDVRPVNDPPTITSGPLSMDRGGTLVVPLLDVGGNGSATPGRNAALYVSDVDGDTVTIVDVDDQRRGSTTFTPTSVTFRHDRSAEPTAGATVSVTDGQVTVRHQLDIEVINTNSPPNLLAGDTSVNDSVDPGSTVFTLVATDPDGDALTYELTDDTGHLGVDPLTGDVVLLRRLDAQATPRLRITASATDSWGDTDSATFTVDVLFDNRAPVLRVPTGLTIAENPKRGSLVGTIGAEDDDGDGITYTIDDPTGTFAIDADTGRLTVVGDADHETAPSVAVVIAAVDERGATVSETVAIDVSDVNEAPVVTAPNFAVFVSEGTAPETEIARVQAVDPEGDGITYALSTATTGFRIDPRTGALVLSGALDYEADAAIDLVVDVIDDGSPTRTTQHALRIVVRDVDEPPTIDTARLVVPENTPAGVEVGRIVATDPESGPLTHRITSASTLFAIEPATGVIRATGPLDYETTAVHDITVSVTDGTNNVTKSVRIRVSDVNEPPVFTATPTLVVDETAPAGTVIGTVRATDPDLDSISFTITAGNPGNVFGIDSASGDLQVSGPLDFEVTPSYNVEVTATDDGAGRLGTRHTVRIFVDDGSESPTLDDQVLTIDENAGPGTSAGFVVAVDPDAGASLTYTITAGNGSGAFEIDASTGEITTAAGTALDHEATPSFDLTVSVTDGIYTDAGVVNIVVVDVDEPPEITAPLFTVFIDELWTAPVTQVIADDPEANPVNYSIVGGDPTGVFDIDPGSGVITVVGVLDAETQPTFALTARATQVGQPGLRDDKVVNIVVQDVDEAPTIISLPPLTVREDAPVGASLGLVQATDPEGESLSYQVTGTEFDIDGSGELRVNAPLDHETAPEHTFELIVTDEADPDALETRMTLTVQVTDVDEPPSFGPTPPLSVAEGTAPPALIGTIVASEPDAGEVVDYAITDTYAHPTVPFAIDPASGELRLTGTPDHETTDRYIVQITVSGGPGTASASQNFTITVTDVNEVPSIPPGQTLTVDETEAVGHPIGVVRIDDPDQAPNHTVSIIAGNTGGEFAIDDDGLLTLASPVDYETQDTYTLDIRVEDGPNTVDGTVTVVVQDGPEPPVLTVTTGPPLYENSPPGTAVATFSATDPDGPGPITYAITSVAPHPFSLDPATGDLTLVDPVDHETLPNSFAVEVTANDGTLDSNPVTVSVPVLDVNESPTATPGQSFTIAENDSTTRVVHAFLADDEDEGDTLTYAITGGTAEPNFRINAANGRIRYNGGLAFDDGQNHTLVVTVTDPGGLFVTEAVDVVVTSRFTLSPDFGKIVFNEVLYFDSTLGEQEVEFVNVSGSVVNTTGWTITDHEPGRAGDETNWTFNYIDKTAYVSGEIGVELIEHIGLDPLRDPLGRIDDLWMWDGDGRLVAYMAWGDANAPGSQITSRPPMTEWGLWSTEFEVELGSAADRQSISLTPHAGSSTVSACWEPTTSGDAAGRCAGALPTVDTSGPRNTSLNEPNTRQPLLISELAVNGMSVDGDFVEVYNAGTAPVDLQGVELEIVDDDGTFTFVLTNSVDFLDPGQHMLFAETSTTNGDRVPASQQFDSKLRPTFGIQLYQTITGGGRHVIDSVGSEASSHSGVSTGAHVEGNGVASPFPESGFDLSYERRNGGAAGNCVDTDDNGADFIRNFSPGTVNPQTLAAPAVPCRDPLPVPGPDTHLLISEYRTDGPNGGKDEFIEFFNPTPGPIDVGGYELHDDGGQEYTFPVGTIIASGGHWLIVADDYGGPSDGSYSGVSNGNSRFELYDSVGTLLDRVDIDSGSDPLPELGGRFVATHQRAAGGCTDFPSQDRNFVWSSVPTPRTSSDPAQPCA